MKNKNRELVIIIGKVFLDESKFKEKLQNG